MVRDNRVELAKPSVEERRKFWEEGVLECVKREPRWWPVVVDSGFRGRSWSNDVGEGGAAKRMRRKCDRAQKTYGSRIGSSSRK